MTTKSNEATPTAQFQTQRAIGSALLWLGTNAVIGLGYVYLLAVASSALRSDPVTAISEATVSLWYAWLAMPVLVVLVASVWGLTQILGHPRLVALLVFGGGGLLMGLGTGANLEGWTIVGLGYGAILVLPGHSLLEWPPSLRGLLVGLGLASLWLVGPLAAMAIGAFRARTGSPLEGGTIALGGTVLTAAAIAADTFRQNVPPLNYLVLAVLLVGIGEGVWLVAGSMRRRESASSVG